MDRSNGMTHSGVLCYVKENLSFKQISDIHDDEVGSIFVEINLPNTQGVLDFGLDGGVPPGPRDPNPCLEVKKIPMFRDFAQKMDPCLGIFCEPRKFL